MDKWIKFSKKHPVNAGFYLVSVKHTFWDGTAIVRSVSVKPFDPIKRVFWGFKTNTEWRYQVEAWMPLPAIYIEDNVRSGDDC